jgi:dihydrofolate reductase
MGRIVVSENISLDGVIQDPNGDEGFAFGGWFQQMSDEDRSAWAEIEFQEALNTAAWLIGRGTYSWFATRWADRPGEWADRLRVIPKYVVSSTIDQATEWANSTVLKGEVVEEVTALKEQVDGDILVYSSRRLVRTLLEHDLVDEVRLMTYPYVLGAGERLFGEAEQTTALRRVAVRPVGESIVLLTYAPATRRAA